MNPGLYLHVPFCKSICPYCDFYVLTDRAPTRTQFIADLVREIELRGQQTGLGAPETAFDTIYFGGGTPSRLKPEQIQTILAALKDHLQVHEDASIYLEANPEDVTPRNIAAWKQLGVHTLSLGVQSLSIASLRHLGRNHSVEQAVRAIDRARHSDFRTVSIDLIYSLPGQDVSSWRRELEQVLELQPDHLSCYELTIHPGTPFGFRLARGEMKTADPGRQADLLLFTHEFLADRGWPGYEVSSFASSPEHRSAHNRKYWNHTPYLGFGPSAHSFAKGRRWWNWRKIGAWQKCLASGELPTEDSESLSPAQLMFESLMFGFRAHDGLDLESFDAETRASFWRANRAVSERLREQKLIKIDGNRLRPTLRGLCVADTLAREFDTSSL